MKTKLFFTLLMVANLQAASHAADTKHSAPGNVAWASAFKLKENATASSLKVLRPSMPSAPNVAPGGAAAAALPNTPPPADTGKQKSPEKTVSKRKAPGNKKTSPRKSHKPDAQAHAASNSAAAQKSIRVLPPVPEFETLIADTKQPSQADKDAAEDAAFQKEMGDCLDQLILEEDNGTAAQARAMVDQKQPQIFEKNFSAAVLSNDDEEKVCAAVQTITDQAKFNIALTVLGKQDPEPLHILLLILLNSSTRTLNLRPEDSWHGVGDFNATSSMLKRLGWTQDHVKEAINCAFNNSFTYLIFLILTKLDARFLQEEMVAPIFDSLVKGRVEKEYYSKHVLVSLKAIFEQWSFCISKKQREEAIKTIQKSIAHTAYQQGMLAVNGGQANPKLQKLERQLKHFKAVLELLLEH